MDAMTSPSPAHAPPLVDRLAFREGMAHLAAAVNVVTTDGPAGRAGFAATAICSVSDTPPTLLVCINNSASSLNALEVNGVLCVNTLDKAQHEVSRIFGGGGPMGERFASGHWITAGTGAPRLRDALVSFDCRISAVVEQGTHKVLFCNVADVVVRPEGRPLVYFGRAYHGLAPLG